MATGQDDEPVGPRGTEEWEEEPPRSMFSATWFRVVIVVLVLGAIAAVSVPYVMDTVSPSPTSVSSSPPPKKQPPPVAPVAAAPAPAAPVAPPATPRPDAKPAALGAVTKASEPAKAEKPPAAAAAPGTKGESPKVDPAKPAPPKSEATASETTKEQSPPTRAMKPAPKAAAPKGETADYWVQVGAFRDPATAKRVAASLKERGFQVAESTMTRGATTEGGPAAAPAVAADRYNVLVTGSPPTEIARKLTAKGLSAEIVGEGAVVQPSLPLREAVALSSDLRGDGFQVTVRRAGARQAAAAPAAAGETLHRVRVGAFGDRAAARAAVEKLEALGYKPFIAKGRD